MTVFVDGLLPDFKIREYAESGMISPWHPGKIKKIATGLDLSSGVPLQAPAVSFGLSSYGYDLTLSPGDFQIFRHVPGLIVNPKQFDQRCLAKADLLFDEWGEYFILPAHTYALGVTVERQKLPDNVTALYIGKSTYARAGIIVNTTPGEAGWEGHLTLEISNSSGADCRIFANEGICQALFFGSVACDKPYGDGKYQNQSSSVTTARI